MKALVLEANGILQMKDIPKPMAEKDECLVRLRGVGVCSSDLVRAFDNGAYRYPLVMGHEFAGEVVEIGADVSEFHVGEEVVAFPLLPCFKCAACQRKKWTLCSNYDYYGSRRDGALSELLSVKAWNLMRIPQGCDVELAGVTEPLAVAVHGLRAIPPNVQGRLAIVGGGFIGLSLGRLALEQKRFSDIVVLDRNESKLEVARDIGLQGMLLKSTSNGYDLPAGMQRSFQVAVEAAGAPETYRLSLALCAPGAHLVWIGNISGDLGLTQSEVSSMLRREITVKGIWNSDFQHTGFSDWSVALDTINRAEWVSKLVTHHPDLEATAQLLRDIHSTKRQHSPNAYIKVNVSIR